MESSLSFKTSLQHQGLEVKLKHGRYFPTPEGLPPKPCRMQGRELIGSFIPSPSGRRPCPDLLVTVSFEGVLLHGPVPATPRTACQPPSLGSGIPGGMLQLIVTKAHPSPSSMAVPHSCHPQADR